MRILTCNHILFFGGDAELAEVAQNAFFLERKELESKGYKLAKKEPGNFTTVYYFSPPRRLVPKLGDIVKYPYRDNDLYMVVGEGPKYWPGFEFGIKCITGGMYWPVNSEEIFVVESKRKIKVDDSEIYENSIYKRTF